MNTHKLLASTVFSFIMVASGICCAADDNGKVGDGSKSSDGYSHHGGAPCHGHHGGGHHSGCGSDSPSHWSHPTKSK
jgi:hypothetical protein